MVMIEVVLNGGIRIKCDSEDAIGDLKNLIAAQAGIDSRKIVIKTKEYASWHNHIKLSDHDIHNETSVEMYCNAETGMSIMDNRR
jgi:ubiquitin-like protein 5